MTLSETRSRDKVHMLVTNQQGDTSQQTDLALRRVTVKVILTPYWLSSNAYQR
jgi:hypothetical protein